MARERPILFVIARQFGENNIESNDGRARFPEALQQCRVETVRPRPLLVDRGHRFLIDGDDGDGKGGLD